ncbi:type VI secretion system lipoprotein TssJ [Escherichia sp. ESNIH1]|uniref:type VI secretion system lipoprotein TssJ n=1 Tax=Escherichia sp. ESNIH1 TaxID=1985876 RepID=UPI000CDCFAA4|nr:type VI secretion system lipoprotein TssJ [Escherichia sp. ESNIH1]POU00269.1 type VI secretion system lipoprotein TssJ [Escherichia sp. ESNIH1]
MLRTLLIKRLSLLLLPSLLTGCGLTQSVSDGTASVVNSVFYKQVKTLHLDITARQALNTDEQENITLSEPLMVRIYQLKDRKTFDKTVYQQLLTQGDDTSATLASRSLVVKPGEAVSLDMPLDEKAQFVAVVALFRAPDLAKNSWKLVLSRDDLDPEKPRVIEAEHNHLTLQPLKDE